MAKSLAGFFVLLATGLPIAAIADDFMDADRALVSGDYATALATYSRLASNGHWGAQFNLGVMYEQGQGVQQSYVEAAKWYRLAVEQGAANAEYNLAVLHDRGRGMDVDFIEAANLYERAAKQGLADAQYNLGVLIMNGNGRSKSFALAAYWYELAATDNRDRGHGHLGAQVNLAILNREGGYGLARDYQTAAKWFRIAAARDVPLAQFAMGTTHLHALGTKRNLVRAYMWFKIASLSGFVGASEYADFAREKLTPKQRRLAEAWVEGCKPQSIGLMLVQLKTCE